MGHSWRCITQAAARIAAQIGFVFVTTDPARDTPNVLRRWLDYFDKRSVGLTGHRRYADRLLSQRNEMLVGADVFVAGRVFELSENSG